MLAQAYPPAPRNILQTEVDGVRFGRPRKLNSDQEQLVCRLLDEGKSAKDLARTFDVHLATIYRLAAAGA